MVAVNGEIPVSIDGIIQIESRISRFPDVGSSENDRQEEPSQIPPYFDEQIEDVERIDSRSENVRMLTFLREFFMRKGKHVQKAEQEPAVRIVKTMLYISTQIAIALMLAT